MVYTLALHLQRETELMNEILERLQPLHLPPLPEKPLVSVLIANYNYANFIVEAIESVLSQTYGNFEIVICDDGSTDDSREIITQYARRDSRVRYVFQDNSGVASALNSAFATSRGEIICLLDADDVFLPEKLTMVVNTFMTHPKAGFVVHPILRIDEKGRGRGVYPLMQKEPSGWLALDLLQKGGILPNIPPCSGMSLRRDVAKKIFPLPPEFRRNADGVIQRIAPFITEITSIDYPLAKWRLHQKNLTNTSKLTVPYIDRELNIWLNLWRTQKEYLASINPKLSDFLAPFEANLSVLMMIYVKERLIGGRNWKASFKKLAAHRDFSNQSRPRIWFWRISPWLPTKVFHYAVNLLSGQNRLKQILSITRVKSPKVQKRK